MDERVLALAGWCGNAAAIAGRLQAGAPSRELLGGSGGSGVAGLCSSRLASVSSKTAARLNRRYRDEPAGGDRYPALKDRAKLRASLRDERRRSSRRIESARPAGESETHRTAGGRAAGRC